MAPDTSPATPKRSTTPSAAQQDPAAQADPAQQADSARAGAQADPASSHDEQARVLSSEEVYRGKVFWVTHDDVEEPGGVRATRDVVRHNGSVVILAVDEAANPADPAVLLIRQYRHAVGEFLLELPAGRIEPGEALFAAAQRELLEETGYQAAQWSRHVTYYASPGFVSEAMNILLAQGLTAGQATPEEDEKIELHMTPLSEALRMIGAGQIRDGKTLIGVLLYASTRSA